MLSVALIQMDIALGKKEQNLSKAVALIKDLFKQNEYIDFILLPELFTTGYASNNNLKMNAEPIPTGTTCKTLIKLAKKYDVTIFGSIAETAQPLPFNTLICATKNGIQATYRKTHLFKLMGEHKLFQPGDEIVSVSLVQGKVGLMTCYDIRFPELARVLTVEHKTQLLLIVAEFPHPRESHWKTLLQARAIENQCFVLAVNRVGSDSNNTFFGMSMVVSPTGEILNPLSNEEQTIVTTLDMNKIQAFRNKIPCLTDRRRDLYS